MAGLGEIVEASRRGAGEALGQGDGRNSTHRNAAKRKGSRARRNSGGSQGPSQISSLAQGAGEERKGSRNRGHDIHQHPNDQKQDFIHIQEDPQAEFYRGYRRVAEEFDREFLKKYDEDLNTTLIFAGLFSAVASAFIIEVDPQLQPDPQDEVAALLRVLIYKIDNTTFGTNVPTLPQWSGPPTTLVHVQAILFTSLATSLFSAFLAMLGKQWLNRYDSADMRGSALERSQNRQQKLDGITSWYFGHVMEALPLMLQISLLLFGCALTRYLWGVNSAVASVAIGTTSFGIIFYLFIVIAGAVSDNCPYQTPVSRTLRHLCRKIRPVGLVVAALKTIASPISGILKKSRVARTIKANAKCYHPWWPVRNIVPFSKDLASGVPGAFVTDVSRFRKSATQALVASPAGTYRSICKVYRRLFGSTPARRQTSDQEKIVLDLRCASWILQTSLDKIVHLVTFEHIVSMPELAYFHPTLVIDCYNVFMSCITVINHEVVTIQGLEQLASMSARSLFRTFHHLSVMDPTSSVLDALRQRYSRVISNEKISFTGLPFRYTMLMIHALFKKQWSPCFVHWDRPTTEEQGPFAKYMAQTARVGYQLMQRRKVPRWILRFALFSLSLDPRSAEPVIASCLMIVALDLGCDTSGIETIDDDSERVEQVTGLIVQTLEAMVEANNPGLIFSKRKAITTLFPYAICLGRGADQQLADAVCRAAEASNSGRFVWHRIRRYLTTLFDGPKLPSLNWVLTLASPQVPWSGESHNSRTVARWAAAVSEVPYAEAIGQSVVDALLQIAHIDTLRPHIPIEAWAWLRRSPSLLPLSEARAEGSERDLIRHIRGLGDIEILKSYFLLVWSELNTLDDSSFAEMEISIREDFGGITMWCHRDDLARRLEQRLEDLEEFNEFVENTGEALRETVQYRKLREVLSEMERAALTIDPASSHSIPSRSATMSVTPLSERSVSVSRSYSLPFPSSPTGV